MNTPELSKSRPRVAILGVTGMIGSAIYAALKDSCDLVVTYRDPDKLAKLYSRFSQAVNLSAVEFNFSDLADDYRQGFAGATAGPRLQQLIDSLGSVDWVVNAMGVTKALADTNPANTLFVNGTVPHILAAQFGKQLIHITTDCVFDGIADAPYDERSPKRPVDIYGLSKSVGEPMEALVIRCSTVGPELGTRYGLWEWWLSQTGTVNGFINHRWNGITSAELGRVCLKLITGEVAHPGAGVHHIFSEDITKEQLLQLFKQVSNHPVEIIPVAAPVGVDRRLGSQRLLNSQLQLRSLVEMVSDLPLPKLIAE